MVMHLVISPTPRDGAEDGPRTLCPWPPADDDYEVLADRRVSVAIRLWVLLHTGPHTTGELTRRLGAGREAVYSAVQRLRGQGVEVEHERRHYRLDQRRLAFANSRRLASPTCSGALTVTATPDGVRLADPRADGLQVRCHIRDGRPRLDRPDEPAVGSARHPDDDDPPRWRPERGPSAGRALGEPRRSVPIWVWGLLKTRPWRPRELVEELQVAPGTISAALRVLRRRGHPIIADAEGRRQIADDGPPLQVQQTRSGLRLAPITPGKRPATLLIR